MFNIYKLSKIVWKLLITTGICLLLFMLFACSKVTQVNFDKIRNNMTMKDVIAILGGPTSSESVTIAGISGTSAIWKENDAEIDIQFLNDKVTVKTYSKPSDQNSKQNDGSIRL
jgi:hypothetical protein